MLEQTKISFIGGGNMAEAIINGLISQQAVEPLALYVSDISEERCAYLSAKYDINITADNTEAIEEGDIIILAIKPQNFAGFSAGIPPIAANKLVISILAGIPTHKIESTLGTGIRVVRVMPNTPALIGHGMAGIAAGKNASGFDIDTTQFIFNQLGKTVVVDESSMDAITGISGSGPAYVFYFVEALCNAAVSLGMTEDQAATLVLQTFKGSIELLISSQENPASLRAKVTSKGGTTERGIGVLESYNIRSIFREAVTAAANRSKELSANA
ncbi:pyrroline-5-carboxylate reductase [bacterium]|nr:pyrroline-5-carboxylate reductase [bacterium]MCP5462201.1 pyrroline-5-carboxylate reductase [bacterium]